MMGDEMSCDAQHRNAYWLTTAWAPMVIRSTE
jgi:hypothetical protein